MKIDKNIMDFEEVYISYYTKIKRFAEQYVLIEHDAENITQDVFLDLWEKKHLLKTNLNVLALILTITKNKCIDFLRRKTLFTKASNTIQAENIATLKIMTESLETFNYDIFSEINIENKVTAALNDLPEKCREIFIMSKIQGKKQKDIAQELHISINTVESQMSIAYKKMKIALKDFSH